jgi:hypothetical protein
MEVVGGSAALTAAAGLVAGTYILMPRSSSRQVEETVGVIRRDLVRMVESNPEDAIADWRVRGSRQILRLSLHLGRSKELSERWPKGLLVVLSLGHSIEQLHEIPDAVAGPSKAGALAALQHLAEEPMQTAGSLRSLAGAEAGESLRQVLLDLARGLEESADLLTFNRFERSGA